MNIVFDLDDTLADSSPRVAKYLYEPGHYADPAYRIKDPDWDAFFAECYNDRVIFPIAEIFRHLNKPGNRVEIWSARCASVRDATERWLYAQRLMPAQLLMRADGDRTDDHLLKERWLLSAINERNFYPDLVFEDRTRLVNMYRSHGIRCIQVANGDF
jgi:hypothetical protein